MNRARYFNYIEEKLSTLGYRIKNRSKINMLELNIHSESFFAELYNILFEYKLINANVFSQNSEGIDLIDNSNKILIQVSATCTKKKIDSSLSKDIYKNYQGYRYKFISIAKEVNQKIKESTFSNPHGMNFNPHEDILDNVELLRIINSKPIDVLEKLYNFIKQELGEDINYTKLDSNLTKIINILSKVDLELESISPEINSFVIDDKIKFNQLDSVSWIIHEYSPFCKKLDEIYCEFDKDGKATSFSILQTIKKKYINLKNSSIDPNKAFYEITNAIRNIIVDSKNFEEISAEELDYCIDILVVDAFLKCKIFENPKGYSYVIAK
ncbi:ABC-three component system protein [Mannheimia varigena]|uniref:ABC-three component system protein n=1 Tax=Mannheimia varigena TaxID=85404 RepID=UPI0015B77B73|nr:ABC-three component system protein [Mannheimia varigena]QLD33897.1 SMEK domain-containing protein [Mannheimia varigena]